jgi:hypothetical protein
MSVVIKPAKKLKKKLILEEEDEDSSGNTTDVLEDIIYDATELEKYGKKSVLEFIQTDIKQNDNFETGILDKIKYVTAEIINGDEKEDMSSRGFYYERLWDICVKFGVTNLTKPAIATPSGVRELQTYHIINENPNEANIVFQYNCWEGGKLKEYLKNLIRSGSSGGYSDITFLNKVTNATRPAAKEADEDKGEELYFISVKYFKEEKGISDYDIGKLCALIREHEAKNRTIKLCIFVKSKAKAVKKFSDQHSSSNILIKYINPGGNYEHVYDTADLHEAYFKLRKLLTQYNYFQSAEDITAFEKTYLDILKAIFIPRFHQKLFISKINELMYKGEKNILVGAIPRSGKSFIMAGTILDCVRQNTTGKPLKFLMMTPAPNETFTEYKDIFNKYIEFDQLGIVPIIYEEGVRLKDICRDKNKHCVIIISKQRLGWSKKKGEVVDNTEVEEIFVDEHGEAIDAEEEEEEEEDDLDKDKEIDAIKKRVISLLGTTNEIDVMFLDEAHFGMSTSKAQKIVQTLQSLIANTVKIYVTATYNKPLKTYGINESCKLTWDINDINIMKQLNSMNVLDNAIEKRFGKKIYEDALAYFGDKSGKTIVVKLKQDYAIFPKPYLITSVWDKEKLQAEKIKIGETEYGFDMNKLFATEKGEFANIEQIKGIMRYYFGYPDKKQAYASQEFYRNHGILPRIKKVCANNCRTLQMKHKTTQLWFLPLNGAVGDTIEKKVKALLNLLTEDNEFKDIRKEYHFFVAIDIKDKAKQGKTLKNVTYMKDPHKIKRDIEEVERGLKEGTINGSKTSANNLIILSGQRLQLGISLRNVDIVTLWNTTTSPDAIFQMLFRSMTEVDVPNCPPPIEDYCNQKKYGFMVDMNPQRALTNVLLFSENMTKKKHESETQQYRQITDLIYIDEDIFLDRYENDKTGRDKFVNDLFNKLYASWNKNVENIKQVIGKFSYDMDSLNKLKTELTKINVGKKGKQQNDPVQDVPEDESIQSGKKQVKVGKAKNKKSEKEKLEEINITNIASELIAEFISLLNIFTLYTDNNSKCILVNDPLTSSLPVNIIDDITILKHEIYKNAATKELFLQILNGRLTGNADKPYSEDTIDAVLNTLDSVNDSLTLNKLIMEQKKKYYSIKEPEKLLEYINENLKPKEKEKKEKGEVFTPIYLVGEMLDKLPAEVWINPDYKWLDPAVGIGNFPIMIYLRLMITLVNWEPDEEKRRTHILENMLYMVEISDKSIFILQKIFCGDKYKLNIHKGSFLEYNTLSKFDVVVGNPPYNKDGVGKGGGVFWKGFVTNALKMIRENGYLLFIHPLGWRKPIGEKASAGDIWEEFKHYNLVFLKISDKKIPHFPSVDYYVLQKTSVKNNTRVINEFETESSDEHIDLYDLTFIPHLINNTVISILHKLFTKPGVKFSIIRNQSFQASKADETAVGVPHTYMYNVDKQTYIIAYKEYKEGIPNYIEKPKIIMTHTNGNRKAYLYPMYYPMQMGSTAGTMYQLMEEHDNVAAILKFLNSEIIHFLLKISQYSESPNHKNEFKILNMIAKPNDGEFENDKDIYDYYSITQDERDLIHKIISNDKPSKKNGKDTESSNVNECPAGKIRNPNTNNCVNDTLANRKKISHYKTGGSKKKSSSAKSSSAKSMSKKTNTLKKKYKYKHLHNKSINKK